MYADANSEINGLLFGDGGDRTTVGFVAFFQSPGSFERKQFFTKHKNGLISNNNKCS